MSNNNNQPALTQEQINSVMTLYSSGQLNEAIAEIKTLNESYPNVPLLFNILGACYQAQGLLEDSAKMFETATKIKPDYAEAHFNLGVVLKAGGQLEAAIESYKKAIYLVPNYPAAYNNLGNIYKDLNQLDDAIESYQKALTFKPDFYESHHNLSLVKKYTKDDDHIRQLNLLLSDPDLDKSDEVYISYSLANAYEDIGDINQQIKFLNQGSKIKKEQSKYKFENSLGILTSLKKLFHNRDSHENLVFDKSSKIRPIFIVGMPRSGTSLVEQIIASHNEVHGMGELKTLSRSIPSIINNDSLEDLTLDETLLSIRNKYLNYLVSSNISQNVITDKMPSNFRYIGYIFSAFPEAKIVHLKRDARATCWSIYKRLFSDIGYGWSYHFDDLVNYFSFYSDLMAFWHELYPNQIYDICYEDLTTNQEEETRKLLEYCDLEWDENCLNFHENDRAVKTASALQVRKKMYQGSSEAWKKYESYLQPLIKGLESY